ncbi:MAG: LytR C-terminal domain-containing protein [Promicromonosporaceae bacterium]|nr:LytR C-terminal domain-containing protein [Promicromonosporaceae bacterium]
MSRNYDYAPDEFDLREAGEVPVGVHRTPPPKWKAMLPFLLVIVIAAAVGIGGALYLSRGFGDEEPTATAPADPDETGEEPAPETPAAPCPWDGNLTVEDLACVEPAPEPVVDYSLTVRVLNNAGITGEAGRGRDGLIEAGFASASAGDVTGGDALHKCAMEVCPNRLGNCKP